MKEYEGIVNKIETMGTLDGPGIRVVIFLSGCPLRCSFCHNPETWNLNGIKMTTNEITKEILNYKNYIQKGGVTFSGGEPLFQHKFLKSILIEMKKKHIHTALDTSGIGNYQDILDLIDLIILDIKDYRPKYYQKITKKSIDSFLKFLSACQTKKKELWLRQVIIPGINDNIRYIEGLKDFIKPIKNVSKVELLPYHNMAIAKYKKLDIPYELLETPNMDLEKLKELEKVLFNNWHKKD